MQISETTKPLLPSLLFFNGISYDRFYEKLEGIYLRMKILSSRIFRKNFWNRIKSELLRKRSAS
ncbi:hypothetical protein LEP1GSC058_2986 [Leptospira fainei serovar Hurstbridge str. BUT 6]|uniref:Uncharacterized protein n=1 Tax=Leptospira fainei serovar Hurstbridge str. BUT 6 TaxID=1193011 RepID=S3UVZ7_9LEPT|nr:hypothetical protein LEP1GSC058_2986 [Leptospira fainei serovar Hurstbridge str. BUT 6]